MSSKVDICNMALSRLAAGRITDLSDGTIEAKECNAIFDIVSKQVQAKGPWMCNKFRIALPQSATAPNFGFAYAYQLPVDPLCLRVLKINEDRVGDNNFQIENNYLLTDLSAVSILYVGLLTDPQKFDPYLEEAIIDALTAQMAYKFTGSIDTAQKLLEYQTKHLFELLNLANLQGSNDYLPSEAYTDIRFADGSSGEFGQINLGQTGDQGV